MEKHSTKGDLENYLRPLIPLDSMEEYYPISAKDQSKPHQFGKSVLRGREVEKEIFLVEVIEELEMLDAAGVRDRKTQSKGIQNAEKW